VAGGGGAARGGGGGAPGGPYRRRRWTRSLVPRPLQWLSDLPRHSPSVREDSPSVREERGAVAGRSGAGRCGRPCAPDRPYQVPALGSPDPGNASATCGIAPEDSHSIREQRGGGGVAFWRRRGDGRAHLSGLNASPRAWLPRLRQCLGHLRNRSGGLAQRQRGAGGRRFCARPPGRARPAARARLAHARRPPTPRARSLASSTGRPRPPHQSRAPD